MDLIQVMMQQKEKQDEIAGAKTVASKLLKEDNKTVVYAKFTIQKF